MDDRDGRVLAQLAGPAQAARLLARLDRSKPAPPISVVRIAEQHGDVIGVASLMSMRPLPPSLGLTIGHPQ